MNGQPNQATWRQRKALSLVIALTLLGAALWVTPIMKDRLAPREAPAAPASAVQAAPSQTAGLPALAGMGDEARQRQQLEISRQELLEREQRVAAHEAALRTELLRGFWTRQALASGITLALTAVAVGILLRRGVGWSALREHLRAEETRLHRLQLSVIGGLQELEASIAGARTAAGTSSEELHPAEPATRSARMQPERSSHPAPAPSVAPSMEDGFALPLPTIQRSARDASYLAAGGEPQSHPEHSARASDARDSAPSSTLGWAERLIARGPRAGSESGARRQRPWSEPVRRASLPSRDSQPEWAPPSQPASPALEPAVPGIRAQIEYLAAAGLAEAEIARRLRVSRDEIRLALTLRDPEESRSRRSVGA
jgi:hypothetical protein